MHYITHVMHCKSVSVSVFLTKLSVKMTEKRANQDVNDKPESEGRPGGGFLKKLFIALICFFGSPFTAFAWPAYCNWSFGGCNYSYTGYIGGYNDGHYIVMECGDEEYGDSWGWSDSSNHTWNHYNTIASYNGGSCSGGP